MSQEEAAIMELENEKLMDHLSSLTNQVDQVRDVSKFANRYFIFFFASGPVESGQDSRITINIHRESVTAG